MEQWHSVHPQHHNTAHTSLQHAAPGFLSSQDLAKTARGSTHGEGGNTRLCWRFRLTGLWRWILIMMMFQSECVKLRLTCIAIRTKSMRVPMPQNPTVQNFSRPGTRTRTIRLFCRIRRGWDQRQYYKSVSFRKTEVTMAEVKQLV